VLDKHLDIGREDLVVAWIRYEAGLVRSFNHLAIIKPAGYTVVSWHGQSYPPGVATSDRKAAWDAVVRAVPARWTVGLPRGDPGRFDPTASSALGL